MTRNIKAVASVDASVDINLYIEGMGQMVEDHIDRGFEPYLITFMFKLAMLNGRSEEMSQEVYRVYSRFLTECVGNPWSEHNMDKRPVLIACPDWPVRKRYKHDRIKMLPWEGAHWHGILLVPAKNRLTVGVKEHFEKINRKAYVRPGMALSRIHVRHISHQPRLATEYVLKSLARGRCTPDSLVVCPSCRSERT
jgi:hypothetical protein